MEDSIASLGGISSVTATSMGGLLANPYWAGSPNNNHLPASTIHPIPGIRPQVLSYATSLGFSKYSSSRTGPGSYHYPFSWEQLLLLRSLSSSSPHFVKEKPSDMGLKKYHQQRIVDGCQEDYGLMLEMLPILTPTYIQGIDNNQR
jgi:hypothetical protein